MAVAGGVGVVKVTHFAQQFQTAVGFVAHIGIEELELVHHLFVRVNLGILTEGGVETLQLDKGILFEADDGVTWI